MNDRSVTLASSDGTDVPAILRAPDHGGITSLTLMLHGITTHKDEYMDVLRRLAGMLAAEGEPSLRIDFRGHGDSPVQPADFSVTGQVIDVLAAMRWCQERGVRKLTILAASFGSPAAIAASYLVQPLVRRIVLIAPVLDFLATFLEPTTEWGEQVFTRDRIVQAMETGKLEIDAGFVASRDFAASLLVTDPRPLIPRFDGSVTILHGDSDGMVPYQASVAAAERYANVRLITMPGTGHGTTADGDEDWSHPQSETNMRQVVAALLGREVE
jgi:uncharacterized protein